MGVLIKPRKVWRLSGDAKTRDDQTAPNVLGPYISLT